MNPQDKNGMSPEDTRNLFIFCIVSLVLFLGYDYLFLSPQKEALRKAEQAQMQSQTAQTPQVRKDEVKPEDRKTALSSSRRIQINNPEITGTISVQGGRIDDIALNNYTKSLEDDTKVTILSPKKTAYPRYIEHGWVSANESLKLPGSETDWQIQGNTTLTSSTPVTLYWTNGNGLTFTKTFSIDDKNLITVSQSVSNDSAETVKLYPYGLVAQRGMPEKLQATWLSHEGPIGFAGEELHELSYKSLRKEPKKTFASEVGWTGITEKYWITALIPPQDQKTNYTFSYAGKPPAKKEKDTGLYQVDYTGAPIEIAPGQNQEITSHVLAGPKKVIQLESYAEQLNAPRLDLAVNFGWFWFMSKPFFYILHYLGIWIGNFGVAIILLTFIIRMAVFPLTNASFKSFAKMKKVSPQVMELRKIHGDDKQKLQTELMALYQREGVNPMAGCVPMIIQIPIFFALYKVLFITIEMRQAPFFGWIQDLSAPDPTSIFNLFGLIPWDPPAILQIGVWPCLMLGVMLVQRKLNPPPQDPIQRDMALYFPFVMAFMMSKFAAGLVIYWTFSGLFSMTQQMIIMMRMGVPIYLFDKSAAEKEIDKQIEKGPAVHPLGEMMEEEVEDAMFGDHDEPEKPVTPPKPKKKKKKK